MATKTTKMSGQIKRMVGEKGFGFILGADGTEYFFHQSGLKNAKFTEVREGQQVTFVPSEGSKGPRAEDVTI